MPVKSSRRGVAWNDAWTGVGDRNVEPDGMGGGLHDELATLGRFGVGGAGDTTLGGSGVGPRKRPGIGSRGGWQEGGARSRHDVCVCVLVLRFQGAVFQLRDTNR